MTRARQIQEMEERLKWQGDKLVENAEQLRKAADRIREMEEELRYWRAAISGVNWLWKKACELPDMQL